MDAGKYYALLRFEEAAVALRAALRLGIVEEMGTKELDLEEFRDLFGFTHQGARTYAFLLEVMEVLERNGRTFRVAPRAAETLADQLPTSRKPYLALGAGDDVASFVEQLRGDFPEASLPLYGSEGVSETLMDLPDVGREIAMGLASRARNFAEPLAHAIRPYAGKARIMADLGAGSPYVAAASLSIMPQLTKVVLVDRPNSMKYAREMSEQHGPKQHGPEQHGSDLATHIEKLEFSESDFFQAVPAADIYCISNTAHDWLADEYVSIMKNVRDSIAPGGVVCVHEPLLLDHWNSAEQWVNALWMACYAIALYKLTQGKGTCYTRGEHDAIMERCTFAPIGEPVPTRDGCTALLYKLQSDIAKGASQETQTVSQHATASPR